MKMLQRYVGRLVRIRPAIFDALSVAVRRRGGAAENSFIVAAVLRTRHQFLCYGADLCVLVSPADVILV